MSKDTFYFSHDYNARLDKKIKELIRKHGMLGYGIWWAIVEDLYNNDNLLSLDYAGIADDLRVDEEIVKSILSEFNLFVKNGTEFGSLSVQSRLDERNERSEKARKSISYRWKKEKEITSSIGKSLEIIDEINPISSLFAIWGKPNPGPGEIQLIENLQKSFSDEEIKKAFYKALAQNKCNLAYVRGILRNNGINKSEKTFSPTSDTMKDILSGKIAEHTK